MADAKALFRRHWHILETLATLNPSNQAATIYAACIIAEAIRNDVEEAQIRVPNLEVVAPSQETHVDA